MMPGTCEAQSDEITGPLSLTGRLAEIDWSCFKTSVAPRRAYKCGPKRCSCGAI